VLDVALSGATVTTTAGTCAPVGADNTVACSLGAVDPADPPVRVVVTALLDEDFTGAISNTATVQSPTPDPESADNTAMVTSSTGPTADLTLVKSVRPRAPVAGEKVTYTVTVHNRGPDAATGVTVTDLLDEQLLGARVATTRGTCAPVGADSTVDCTLGSLGDGRTASITITATVAGGARGTLTSTASVSSPTRDPNEADNADTVTSRVVVDTDVSLVKRASSSRAEVGDDVAYTLVVSNAGPSTARAVVVTDRVPAGLRVSGTRGSIAGAARSPVARSPADSTTSRPGGRPRSS
jgi:uncharacterized repeat protein (TIGR01451 family)